LLGDIPVIGYLFRSTDTSIQKQNLLLLLTPYVIEDSSDLDKIREKKMEEREAFLEYFGSKDLNYIRSVNFDKKHGILEAIRQAIDETEAELSLVQGTRNVLHVRPEEEGIELPEGMDDGYGSDAGTGQAGTTNAKPQTNRRPSNRRDGRGNRPVRNR
jgi:hypothetical protein